MTRAVFLSSFLGFSSYALGIFSNVMPVFLVSLASMGGRWQPQIWMVLELSLLPGWPHLCTYWLSLLSWTMRESGGVSEEDANLRGLVLDGYWKWIHHHERWSHTVFILNFWSLQSQWRSINKSFHISESQCEVPASCFHQHLWKEISFHPSVLSLCLG